jgi:excisionase family DNA binding protein
MNRNVVIPQSVKKQIINKANEKPPVLLPEDRDEFIRSISDEEIGSQVPAETHWNNMVDLNNDEHRLIRRKEGAVTPLRKPYFLTVDQIAVRWNMSARTVWRMIREKRLPSRLIGSSRRVLEEDVERFEMADMAVA